GVPLIRTQYTAIIGAEDTPTKRNSNKAATPADPDPPAGLVVAGTGTLTVIGCAKVKAIKPAPKIAKNTPGPTLVRLTLLPPRENSPAPLSRRPLRDEPRKRR